MMAFHGQLTYLLNIAGHNIDCFHELFHHFKFNKVLTSGTQKSGTHERTPKSGSEAGAPLLLCKERESGAALNFFWSEEFEQFLAFQLKKC